MPMPKSTDKHGQLYWDVENIRITCLSPEFASTPSLRIQAYRKDPKVSQSLSRGVEIPIPTKGTGLEFITTVIDAVIEVMARSPY